MQFKGQDSKLSIIIGAMAVSDIVKSTLGPKGMDKILQGMNGDITVTNDGATILRRLTLDNPAAKILVDISKTQDEEVLATPTRFPPPPSLATNGSTPNFLQRWHRCTNSESACGILHGLALSPSARWPRRAQCAQRSRRSAVRRWLGGP